MKYVIGTGYHDHGGDPIFRDLFHYWHRNTLQYAKEGLSDIHCVACGGCRPPALGQNTIHIKGDLGHIRELIDGQATHQFAGGEIVILTLALLAYNDNSDFIYKEQDCFAFGPWVQQMYEEIGDAGLIHGKRLTCDQGFCGLSLMLIRHRYIPVFVSKYLSYRKPDKKWLMEFTMLALGRNNPDIRQLSFGYDRDRPFNANDRVWYIQAKHPEVAELRDLGLVGR